MLIHVGTHESIEALGFVADFCPLSRDVTVWRIERLGEGVDIYGLEISKGKLRGYRSICLSCGMALPCDPNVYTALMPFTQVTRATAVTANREGGAALASLVTLTNANWTNELGPRLALEDKLRNYRGSLTSGERMALIQEPFQALEPMAQAFKPSKRLDTAALLCAAAAVFIPALIFFMLCDPAVNRWTPNWQWPVFGTMAVCVVSSMGFATLAQRRGFYTQVYRALIAALALLEPTRAELEEVLLVLKQRQFRIASQCTAEQIFNTMSRFKARPDSQPQPGENYRVLLAINK